MQHHKQVARCGIDTRFEPAQQDFVEAFFVVAQRRIVGMGQILAGHPCTYALAAGIVVAPEHVHAGMGEHVEQAFGIACIGAVVVVSILAREHARYRHRCGRTAGTEPGEVDQIASPQPWIGIARIPIQRKIGGAGGLPNDQHHHPSRRTRARLLVRIRAQRLDGPVGSLGGLGKRFDRRVQRIGRIHQIAQFAILAQHEGEILVVAIHAHAQHRDRDC